MSFSSLRKHINEQIQAYDSDLVEWEDAFNNNNIPQSIIEHSYHIGLDPIGGTPTDDQDIRDVMSVSISFWTTAPSQNETIEPLLALMDKVCEIRNRIISPSNLELFRRANLSDNVPLSIEAAGVTPEPINDTNDNTLKVILELDARYFTGVS